MKTLNIKYKNFILANKNCSGIEEDPIGMMIFQYLCLEKTVISMILASDVGMPAISPCVKDVESLVYSKTTKYFKDTFKKQAVGIMIKYLMSLFAYSPYAQKILPKNSGSIEFRSGSVYRFDESKIHLYKIIKKIVKV